MLLMDLLIATGDSVLFSNDPVVVLQPMFASHVSQSIWDQDFFWRANQVTRPNHFRHTYEKPPVCVGSGVMFSRFGWMWTTKPAGSGGGNILEAHCVYNRAWKSYRHL